MYYAWTETLSGGTSGFVVSQIEGDSEDPMIGFYKVQSSEELLNILKEKGVSEDDIIIDE